MSDDVPRPPHTYSILVSPLKLPEDKLTFSQKWLFYEGNQRLPVEHLAQLLDETSEFHKKNKNLYRSRTFLRAQQIMLLDRHNRREMPNLNDSAEVLRKRLSKVIRDGRTTPPDILALEDAARKQWDSRMGLIQNIITSTAFVSLPESSDLDNLNESISATPPRKKKKRNRDSLGSRDLTHAARMSVDLPQDSPPDTPAPSSHPPNEPAVDAIPSKDTQAPVSPQDASIPSDKIVVNSSKTTAIADLETGAQSHSRGDNAKFGTIDTERYRARMPGSVARSYLLQLLVDHSMRERAVQLTSSRPLDLRPTTENTIKADNPIQQECLKLVRACVTGTKTMDQYSYYLMIARMELAIWYLRVKAVRPYFTVADAYNLIEGSDLNCTESQFRRWHSQGHIYLRLVHASSIHILSAIAVSTLRDTTNRILDDTLREIENGLRQPEDIEGVLSGLVIAGVVQFSRYMQTRVPDGVQLAGQTFGVNLEEDDRYLAALLKGGRTDFKLLSRGPSWSEDRDPFPELRSLEPGNHTPCPTVVIKTNFNPAHEQNRRLPPELEKNPKKNHLFTEKQRKLAQLAEAPTTIEEFETKLCKQLESGIKVPNQYLKLRKEHLEGRNILIHGQGGEQDSLICFVMDTFTLTRLELAYITQITKLTVQLEDEIVDTSKKGAFWKFKGHHIGVWGKMSKSGRLRPRKVHPRQFLASSAQAGPYLDRAVRLLHGNFNLSHFMHCPQTQFQNAIELILRPAIAKLKEQIPNLLAQHEELSEELNPVIQLGSTPFCMTVLNVQPATRAHRDSSDHLDSICLVLPLGDYEDGGLCLYESGIRLELVPGTFVAIRSKRDLHFNLHFKGQRFSYVFTSDEGLKRWAKDRNHMRDLQLGYVTTDSEVTPESEDEADGEDN